MDSKKGKKKFNVMNHLNTQASGEEAGQDAPRRAPLKVVPLSVHELIPSKDNFYSLSDIEGLKRSIEFFGVKQNLTVKPLDGGKYEIIAGHRRHKACLELVNEGKAEFEYIPCGIETGKDEIKERILLIMTNSTSRTLSDWEKMKQAEELKAYCEAWKERDNLPGRVRDMVAEIMQESATQIGRLNAIANNLTPELQAEMQAGNLGVSAASELAKLDHEKQAEAYTELAEKGGLSIKDAKALNDEAETPPQQPPPDSLNPNPPDNADRDEAAAAKYIAMYEQVTGADAPEYTPEEDEEAENPPETLDFADMNDNQKREAAIDFMEGKRFEIFPPGSDTRIFDYIVTLIEFHV